MLRKTLSSLVIALSLSTSAAFAVPMLTTGSGAVTTVDRMATFDNVISGVTELSTYTEDNLAIQTQITVQAFGNGRWYANAGFTNGTLAIIKGTDNARMSAIEFDIGSGGGQSWPTFLWESYRAGILTGTGTTTNNNGLQIVGISDVWGIDELRVGLIDGPYTWSNPIQMDNVKVELYTGAVPVPASGLLVASSFALVGYLGRYRKAKNA